MESFQQHIRLLSNSRLQTYYDLAEGYMTDGVLDGLIGSHVERCFGNRYAVNIIFGVMAIYREVARRHYS